MVRLSFLSANGGRLLLLLLEYLRLMCKDVTPSPDVIRRVFRMLVFI